MSTTNSHSRTVGNTACRRAHTEMGEGLTRVARILNETSDLKTVLVTDPSRNSSRTGRSKCGCRLGVLLGTMSAACTLGSHMLHCT